jgi:hypothetical protein
LYYNRARYYSPKMSRFISEDPIGLLGGTNVFAYANGNPLSNRDPLGLDAFAGLTGGISSAEAQALSAVQNAAAMVAGCISSFLHEIKPVYAIPIFDALGALGGAAWGTANIGLPARAADVAEIVEAIEAGEATGDLVILGGVGLADTVASGALTGVLLGTLAGTGVGIGVAIILYVALY